MAAIALIKPAPRSGIRYAPYSQHPTMTLDELAEFDASWRTRPAWLVALLASPDDFEEPASDAQLRYMRSLDIPPAHSKPEAAAAITRALGARRRAARRAAAS